MLCEVEEEAEVDGGGWESEPVIDCGVEGVGPASAYARVSMGRAWM